MHDELRGEGTQGPSRNWLIACELNLTAEERSSLLAFLGSLSSDATPKPLINTEVARSRAAVAGSAVSKLETIGQKKKALRSRTLSRRSRRVTGDRQQRQSPPQCPHRPSTHRISSGMQVRDDEVKVEFPEEGKYENLCAVHPNMRLMVEVPAAALRK